MDHAVVVGAGPSGMAAALELSRHGMSTTVLDREETPGGLSRTVARDGCRFDIGPHRFFTKNDEVQRLVVEVLADRTVQVHRRTRVMLEDRFFDYPLRLADALHGLGPLYAIGVVASYAQARAAHWIAPRQPASFEDWVMREFGSRLYATFFKDYTEKVWGIPCTAIGAEWASQRIKGLSLAAAIRNACRLPGATNRPKSLVGEFAYPRLGAGQLYEMMASRVVSHKGTIRQRCTVTGIIRNGKRVRAVRMADEDGVEHEVEGTVVLTSAPLAETIAAMDPPPPPEVRASALHLRYRDHICVNLKVRRQPFPDNWLYIHSNKMLMSRVSSYGSFSRDMCDPAGGYPLTVEYFTFAGDPIWQQTDGALGDLAIKELAAARLVVPEEVLSAFVVRSRRAYPSLEVGYDRHVAVVKAWLDEFENFLSIGRAGLHRYNNQDHSIATGLLAARTALGLGKFDPWLVNTDAAFHEEARIE